MPQKTLLPMGRITKAHGIRGEVCVTCYAGSPSLLRGEVYLAPPGTEGKEGPAPRKALVTAVRADQARTLLRIEGVDDRTAAERLRGCDILLPASALPPPEEGEAYVHQLFGLAVFARAEDGAEREIGVLDDVAFPAGQEIWTIVTPDGAEILFPAVPEFVAAIDLDAGNVHITPPPGLLELYL